jgi:aspartate/methionine/tyrosine aminotransferase
MTQMPLLAKPILPPDWIDVSVGEPHVVREHLMDVFDIGVYDLPKKDHMYEYPPPNGYKPLVQLLESKHRGPVIVTNGAKQALGACFYALQQMGKLKVGMRTPYWALIPPLVKMHGLEPLTSYEGADANLVLLPNNPDGFSDLDFMSGPIGSWKQGGIPLIHDAAYYTPVYLPNGHQFPQFGDVQVYSISKMLGLSGLRLGYVVCPNPEFYKLILEYMEAMTVGASIVSQIFLYDLMNRMNGYPTLVGNFEGRSQMSLLEAKELIAQVDSEVLEVPPSVILSQGMFGWFKTGPKFDQQKAKINFIDGALFGVPGMVRMNLAFNSNQMQEIVKRLNSCKE